MKLKCYDVQWMFNNFGNLYFMDETGKIYYWYTKSDKAFEQINVGTVIEVTSFKDGEQWHMDGEEYNTMTNVRFKVIDEDLIAPSKPDEDEPEGGYYLGMPYQHDDLYNGIQDEPF